MRRGEREVDLARGVRDLDLGLEWNGDRLGLRDRLREKERRLRGEKDRLLGLKDRLNLGGVRDLDLGVLLLRRGDKGRRGDNVLLPKDRDLLRIGERLPRLGERLNLAPGDRERRGVKDRPRDLRPGDLPLPGPKGDLPFPGDLRFPGDLDHRLFGDRRGV